MTINKTFNDISGSAIICASVSGIGAVAAYSLNRPPHFAALFLAMAFLFKKAVLNCVNNILPSKSKQNILENTIDVILPCTYYKVANSFFTKFFSKYNLDFCLPGTFITYFIVQKLTKMMEQGKKVVEEVMEERTLDSKKDTTIKANSHSSLLKDTLHVIIAAISGAISDVIITAISGVIFGKKSFKDPNVYINESLVMTLIAKISVRFLSILGQPSKQEKKILENCVYLSLPWFYMLAGRGRGTSFRYITAHIIGSIFCNIIKTLQPSD